MRHILQVQTRPGRLFALVLLTCMGWVCRAAPPLTGVRQIRQLTPNDAAGARPVLLRGVVTVLSGWKNSFFLQAAGIGISVNRDDVLPEVASGDLVEISGVTGPGKFAPVIISRHIAVLRRHSLPQPRLYSATELAGGQKDAQWVAIQGIVRSADIMPHWGHSTLFLKVDMGGGTPITALIRDYNGTGTASLVGAGVSIRGVCGTVFNDRRQFVGLRLYVDNFDEVTIQQAAPKAPFDLPVTPVGSVLQFDPRPGAMHPVKLSGVVTSVNDGKGLYLQDATGGTFVQASRTALLKVGTKVEAVGYPTVGQYSPKLEDAIVRAVGSAPPPAPKVEQAAHMIAADEGFTSAPLDASLVRVTGKLIEKVPKATETLLLLQQDSTIFAAHLPKKGGSLDAVTVGSVLGLTGICMADEDEFHELTSFDLLLRTPDDVAVLRGPPWWTPTHALWVVILLAVAMLGTLGWAALVRKQHSLREMAVTDPLTGLYNRRGFLLLARQQWQMALRRRSSFLLFYMDVNEFKGINDTFGHLEGDHALCFVAKVLQDTFRKADILCRMGGDEFAVAALDATEESADMLKERIAAAVDKYSFEGHKFQHLTLSIGVLVCDAACGNTTLEEMLTRADTMMYEEKRKRKDGSAISPGAYFEPSMMHGR